MDVERSDPSLLARIYRMNHLLRCFIYAIYAICFVCIVSMWSDDIAFETTIDSFFIIVVSTLLLHRLATIPPFYRKPARILTCGNQWISSPRYLIQLDFAGAIIASGVGIKILVFELIFMTLQIQCLVGKYSGANHRRYLCHATSWFGVWVLSCLMLSSLSHIVSSILFLERSLLHHEMEMSKK